MNYSGINFCDTANGPGVRVSLFVSGCSLHCKGCFNREAWDKEYGKKYDHDYQILTALSQDYVEGLSILGGDPLQTYNIDTVLRLCKRVKKIFPNKTIWLWTGRKYEDVKDHPIMDYIDVLVDGPFIERKKCNERYKGSSNQRIVKLYARHAQSI